MSVSFPQQARVEAGKLVILNPASWRASLAKLDGQEVTVTVECEQSRRSTASNRYYWGVIVKFFQSVWSQARKEAGLPPYTREETHSVLVQVLVGSVEGPKGVMLPRPTRDMPQDVFSQLITDAKEMAWHDYEVRLPDSDEPWGVEL